MWKILCRTSTIAGVLLGSVILLNAPAKAQSTQQVFNSQQFGFNLPRPPIPNGFDEVRASDGTTCRSSIAGNGPYLDLGGIGSEDAQGGGNLSGATVYGRITIPLGEKPTRLDCAALYQLELQRLQHELNLAKAALRGANVSQDAQWNNE